MSKLRESAKDKHCTLQIPGVCNMRSETVVLAHLRIFGFGGTGKKPRDIHGVYACFDCHDAIDSRRKASFDRYEYLLRALMRTHEIMSRDGLLGYAS